MDSSFTSVPPADSGRQVRVDVWVIRASQHVREPGTALVIGYRELPHTSDGRGDMGREVAGLADGRGVEALMHLVVFGPPVHQQVAPLTGLMNRAEAVAVETALRFGYAG